MPFLIRYSTDVTPGSVYQVDVLAPNPTEVEYPVTREYNARTTQDHAVIIQRPLKDSRIRKWSWRNYRPTIGTYENQWATLLTLESRARDLDTPQKNPIIQIWENVTGEGGFGETTDQMAPDLTSYTNIDWVQVKFLQVHRSTRKGSGNVVYDESTIEFLIADPSWESF